MPPLTLEQVLARSMRLPQGRAKRSAGGLFSPAATVGRTPPFKSASSASSSSSAAKHTAHTQTLSFFDMLEQEETARTAGRLSIQSSDHLVRNSADLLTFLHAARQMRAWEDALVAFTRATGLPELEAGSVPAKSASTVSPSQEHVTALLDTLAAAGQWTQVLTLTAYFSHAFPDVVVHTVAAMCSRGRGDGTAQGPAAAGGAAPALVEAVSAQAGEVLASSTVTPYDAALHYLHHSSIRRSDIPVAAYNAVLTACEEAKDWRAALRTVRAMGPNPLQGWAAPEEGIPSPAEAGASADASTPAPVAATSSSVPPSPDVVTYATLIATLEQAGKDSVAAQVLGRLPSLEKEEITASYAALIYVWSNQAYQKKRRGR